VERQPEAMEADRGRERAGFFPLLALRALVSRSVGQESRQQVPWGNKGEREREGERRAQIQKQLPAALTDFWPPIRDAPRGTGGVQLGIVLNPSI
jgi:hypothetical protein